MASDDDYSDLTELESDYEVENSKKKAKPDDSGKGGYRIRNALKVPRATTYTAQALYDQIHSNDINLEPEYQRDVVWSEAKQIGVIDSIYRNFYIPPIIFAVNCHEDGSETKTCIDGKQRLTSIYKFMDGLIPHRDAETGTKYWYKDNAQAAGRPKRKLLSLKYRKMFANKQIVCVEYQEINDAAEREIFQRVQLGMALTPAEKLQVIKTKRADFVRGLQNKYLKEEGRLCGEALEWETGRGSDFRCLSQALNYMEKLDSEGSIKTLTIQQTEKWLNIEEGFTVDFERSVEDAYNIFANMVEDKKYNHVFKKPGKVSPIEFIMMCVMIFMHKGEASMAQLAAGISQMRTEVRVTHVDIRMNTRVTKDFIDFITKWKPPKISGDTGVPIGNPSLNTGVKRKRPTRKDDEMDVDEEDDDDDEDGMYRAKAKKKVTPSVKVKAEPTNTPMPFPSYPATDRLAALHRAREEVTQRQAHIRSQAAPPAQNSGLATPTSANEQGSPQMLPSPGLPFSFPSSSTQSQRTSSSHLPLPSNMIRIPPLPGSNNMVSSSSRSNLPPPPSSANSFTTDRDRDREEDRRRDHPSLRDSRDYDNRDRYRYNLPPRPR